MSISRKIAISMAQAPPPPLLLKQQNKTAPISKRRGWASTKTGRQVSLSLPSRIASHSVDYPLTAPAVRPLIIYFWKKKNTNTMGSVPTTEMELTRDQS